MGSCSGSLFAASAYKNGLCRCLVAAFCAGALFCVSQTAVAKPEAFKPEIIKPEAAQAASAFTGKVRAEGIAVIGAGGRNAARQAALSDALRNLVKLANPPAMASKFPGIANEPQQNVDAQPAQQGSRYSILREWEDREIYHVTVSAEVVNGKFDAENATLIRVPKKKIAITQFDVANTIHVDDINNIYDGLPIALSSRLEASGEFLSAYASRAVPAEVDVSQRDAIIQIAAETGAQFLISGMVVNAGTSTGKLSLESPFGGPKKRHFEIEFSVYDGLTGVRLLSRRLGEQAQGDVMVGNNKPFGSSIFFETEFGKATNRLLDSAVKEIHDSLESVPFSAHIIRIEGKKIFLDAGGDSLLKPGDKFVVYASDARIAGLKGSTIGVAGHAVDAATLIDIQPQFSIGELSEDAAKFGIKIGCIAKINFADQRDLAAKQLVAQQLVREKQHAKAEAERIKAEQAAQVEAARIKAEQAIQAEAARVKADKKAKEQAAAEAKAAKLKAQKAAIIARGNAAQKARERALAVRIRAAQKTQAQAAAAEAKAAKLKAQKEAKAEASKIKAGQEPSSQAEPKTAVEENTPGLKTQPETKTEAPKVKAAQESPSHAEFQTATEDKAPGLKTQPESKAEVPQVKTKQKAPTRGKEKTTAKDEIPQTGKMEGAVGKTKYKVLPPGEAAIYVAPKSAKP
jgi:hypothetical protein